MITIIVGEKFPIPPTLIDNVSTMTIIDGSMNCVIKLSPLSNEELEAFKTRRLEYSYFESKTSIPIIIWSFKICGGIYEAPFNSKAEDPEDLKSFLHMNNGNRNNAMTFYLLDEQDIVRGIRLCGLHQQALKLFHNTIQKQDSLKYNDEDFNRDLNQVQQKYDIKKLFKKGETFKL